MSAEPTLLPGLVDAHVHLYMEATADPARRQLQLHTTYEERRPVMERALQSLARAGVVAVRDGGDYGGFAWRYCREHSTAPVVVCNAGRAWRAPGRYGKLIGRPPREGETLAEAVQRDLVATPGMELVKIAQSGVNSLVTFGKTTKPQFTREELRAVVTVAHAHGRTVMVHANGPEAVRRAIEAGCDSIEHGFFATLEVLKRACDTGTVWVPTLAPMWAYAQAPGVPDGQRDVARRTLEAQLETVGRAVRAGVTVAAGSDAGSLGVVHGPGLWAELWLLRQAGLSVDQVLEAATTVGARLLRLEALPTDHIAVAGPRDQLFSDPAPTITRVGPLA